MRTKSGLEQRTNHLPSRRRLLILWLSSLKKVFQEEAQQEEPESKDVNVQKKKFKKLAGTSTEASKATLLRSVKHQRKKMRRLTMSIKTTTVFYALLMTSPSNNSD